jgi:hypothetical protein
MTSRTTPGLALIGEHSLRQFGCSFALDPAGVTDALVTIVGRLQDSRAVTERGIMDLMHSLYGLLDRVLGENIATVQSHNRTAFNAIGGVGGGGGGGGVCVYGNMPQSAADNDHMTAIVSASEQRRTGRGSGATSAALEVVREKFRHVPLVHVGGRKFVTTADVVWAGDAEVSVVATALHMHVMRGLYPSMKTFFMHRLQVGDVDLLACRAALVSAWSTLSKGKWRLAGTAGERPDELVSNRDMSIGVETAAMIQADVESATIPFYRAAEAIICGEPKGPSNASLEMAGAKSLPLPVVVLGCMGDSAAAVLRTHRTSDHDRQHTVAKINRFALVDQQWKGDVFYNDHAVDGTPQNVEFFAAFAQDLGCAVMDGVFEHAPTLLAQLLQDGTLQSFSAGLHGARFQVTVVCARGGYIFSSRLYGQVGSMLKPALFSSRLYVQVGFGVTPVYKCFTRSTSGKCKVLV